MLIPYMSKNKYTQIIMNKMTMFLNDKFIVTHC